MMDVIYTTNSMSLPRGFELSQRAGSERQTTGFTGRRFTLPAVFTFEPMLKNKKTIRRKRRTLKVLYPPGQVRRSLPTEKDMTKRLLLFLVSIVLFQVYIATEDELSLSPPDLDAVKPVPASLPAPSSPGPAALSVVVLAASPGAEANCTQQLAAGHSLQTARVIRSCSI
uniref:radiation-inducible immediate-early gene IEX-1-like n=1 Tax=Pristiophorus japonicus TaxID=55135 RepID=UPI00398F2D72